MDLYRVLFLSSGPVPPPEDPLKSVLFHLSSSCTGDYISPMWGKKSAQLKVIRIGNFEYRPIFSMNYPMFIRYFYEFPVFLFKALLLHREKRYNVVVARDPLKTGFVGVLLKFLTGVKLIVDVRGNFEKAFTSNSENIDSGIKDRLKRVLVRRIITFVLRKSDSVKLLYPSQIGSFDSKGKIRTYVFHDFVPLQSLHYVSKAENFIFFLGYPWYLKGVDILINAFKLISSDFPDYKLKVAGYCEDKTYFEELCKGCDKIELLNKGFPHHEAMELMSRCAVVVLPSRTEAMGRVLLEAMALSKPIVASRVDGIPTYVKDRVTGLLFTKEDVQDLADKLRIVLSNRGYASKLAKAGNDYVYEELSEKAYLEKFTTMLQEVLL